MSKCTHPTVVEGNTGYFCSSCGSRVGEYIARNTRQPEAQLTKETGGDNE